MTEVGRARTRRPGARQLDARTQSLAVDLILSEGLSMEDAVARVRALRLADEEDAPPPFVEDPLARPL
jgi:hypothetical protein